VEAIVAGARSSTSICPCLERSPSESLGFLKADSAGRRLHDANSPRGDANFFSPVLERFDIVITVKRMYIRTEFMLFSALLALAVVASCFPVTWLRYPRQAFKRLANRRGLAVFLVGLTSLSINLTAGFTQGIPEPQVSDEFSYLLAADTFVQGRVTNPTHSFWKHFVAAQTIHVPSYQSKYPPGQGLVLALGQLFFGHPIFGVWISLALASAATCWMLQAWLPARWAFLGGLIVATHVGLVGWWGQTYWGGAVAMAGGALLFGGLRRLVRSGRTWDGVFVGLGVAILANSRPYEGFLTCLPAAVLMFGWILSKAVKSQLDTVKQPVLATGCVLFVTFVAMGYYNFRVSGHPLRLPYQQTLEPSAATIILAAPRMKMVFDYLTKIRGEWQFYIRCLLLPPLLMFPWLLQNRWTTFACLTCLIVLIAFLLAFAFGFPHYTAPITCLIFTVLMQGMRHLRYCRFDGRPLGQVLVPLLSIALIFSPIIYFKYHDEWYRKPDFLAHKAELISQLTQLPGQHLVLIEYGPQHDPSHEWVRNGAEIDGSRVVWARSLGQEKDKALTAYYADRQAWRLMADERPPRLMPLPTATGQASQPILPPAAISPQESLSVR